MTMILKFANLSKCSGLIHAVTTRYFKAADDFNLADYAGRNNEQAIANRRLICEYLQINFDRLTVAQQRHNSGVAIVDDRNAGTGKFGGEHAIPDSDALITELKDTPLMMFSADCPLVIVYEPDKSVVGLMHCSWRAIVKGIVANTIDTMRENFKIDVRNLIVGVGPGAGKCCYRVDEKFVEAISTAKGLENFVVKTKNNMTFDLHGAILYQLSDNGIANSQIETMGICTICDERFFSYRREGTRAGRFALIASTK